MLLRGKNLVKLCKALDANNSSRQQSSDLPQTCTALTPITTQASDKTHFSAPPPRIKLSSDFSIIREASPNIVQTSSTSHEPISNLNSASKTEDISLPIDDKELLDAVNFITDSVPYCDHHSDLTVNVNSIEDAYVSPSHILLEANARTPLLLSYSPYMKQSENIFENNNVQIALSPVEYATTIIQPEIIQNDTSSENIRSTHILLSPQNQSSHPSSGLPQTSTASTLITSQASDTLQFGAPSPRITLSSITLSNTREESQNIEDTALTSLESIHTLPPTCERHECSDPDYIPVSSNDANDEQNQSRPKRGRKRKYPEQNRNIRKKRANCNEDYISVKGKEVTRKIFSGDSFDCKCPKRCTDTVTAEERKKEFDRFWMCGNYGARCAILQGCVAETETKRSYTANSKRNFTRYYRVNGKTVCKKTFLNTFGISQTRIDFALKKLKNQQPVNDQRGQKSGGKNATSSEKLAELKAFINSFPRYVSHYSRNNTTANYLAPNLNIAKLYDLYKEKHPSGVSLSKFSKVFHTDFNLCFKKNQKDTCYRCDRYKALKSSQASTSTEASIADQEHKKHLDRAYNLRNQMKQDLESAKTNPEIETLTFDLEKTHCLPKVPTSIVYYKRQLNLHNLGIHSGSSGKGYFYVWVEYESGRGTQEVGSCLKRYIEDYLKTGTTHLILWADSCGGQNRSIKLVLMLKYILQRHSTLKKITLRFLQPGHTYLPNDSEFGDVECALKTHNRLYTADDYIEVMESCRRKNKFTVTRMTKEKFFSISPIQDSITNRKTDINKQKISWLSTCEIIIRKEDPTKIYMNENLADADPKIIDISKGTKGRKVNIDFQADLPVLYPEGRELSTAKVKDLKEILKLVPQDAKTFYNFLKNTNSFDFIDDVDGFGTNMDFDFDLDDVD